MPSDLSNYLVSRYLVVNSKSNFKKRKRKQASGSTGLVITDDDDTTWDHGEINQDGTGEDSPLTVSGTTTDFRKTRKNNWKSVDGKVLARDTDVDAIIASTIAEKNAARVDEDGIAIVENCEGITKMGDGTHAGLQSAIAVSAQLRQRQQEERQEFERYRNNAIEEETVYRDATGRRIDVSMKRAEARRAAAEAEGKKQVASETLKGLVQQEESERRKQELELAKLMEFARNVDNEDMNRELKDQERWNDPMMQFLTSRTNFSHKRSTSKRPPLYDGTAPPNRYGINPGYRWDGVDRGNGMEAERYKALNRRERNKGLDYAWQMDE